MEHEIDGKIYDFSPYEVEANGVIQLRHPHYAGIPSPGCDCSGCELLREGATFEDRRQDARDLYQQCAESDHQLRMCSQCYPAVDPPDIDLDDTRLPW